MKALSPLPTQVRLPKNNQQNADHHETHSPSECQVIPEISTLPWDSPEFYPHAHTLAGKRLGFIVHKGKRILNINSAGADFQLIRAIAAECAHIIAGSNCSPYLRRSISTEPCSL